MLLHLVLRTPSLAAWLAAAPEKPAAPPDLSPASLAETGFVHASPDDATALAVANMLFREPDAAGHPLVALVLDRARIPADVRDEPADPAPPPGVAPDRLFPHIYGPLPRAAVVGVRYARADATGAYTALEERPATADALDLLPHPEGGWYRRTWVSGEECRPDGYPAPRPTATAVHFLLPPGARSRWHAVRSDELWLWQRGGPLLLVLGGTGDAPAEASQVVLGPDVAAGQVLQALVPGGTWQAARPAGGDEALATCVVSPGFDFQDFRVS